MKKKTLSSILILAILSAFIPVIASAAEGIKYGDYLYYVRNSPTDITITGCDISATEIAIPREIEGVPVTRIGDNAFENCTNLTNISIPDSAINIGSMAFNNCTELASVTIPDSVTKIGYNAFLDCTGLQNVTIGSGVTQIDRYIFENCTSLETIDVSEKNKNYCSVDGNVFSKDKTELIMYAPGKTDALYTVPNGVKTIGYSAFEDSGNMVSITIPEGVESLGENAFAYCIRLASITLPDSLTDIPYNVFEDTAYYKNDVNWQDNVLYIGNHLIRAIPDEVTFEYRVKGGTKVIADGAFSNFRNLESIRLPSSVTVIGERAFNRCEKLREITLWDGVIKIGANAFANCEELENITIPDGVTSIGRDIAYNTACMKKAENWRDNVFYIGNYIIASDSAEEISVDTLRIDADIVTIADGALEGCAEYLTSIEVDEDNTNFTSVDGNLFSKDKTRLIRYAGGKDDLGYIVPDGVTNIDDAFSYSSNLEVITIPKSVILNSYYTFICCDNLRDVYYLGTEEEWYSMPVTDDLTGATIHFGIAAPNPDIAETSPDTYTISNIQKTGSGVEVTIQANEEVSGRQAVIAAVYDENGVFLGLQSKKIKCIEVGTEQTISVGVENENAVNVKAFVWNALNSMMPASHVVKMEL